MACDHTEWVCPAPVLNDYASTEADQWITPDPYQRSTTVDLDIGRYKCTRCGEVMYYTGQWREHWQGVRTRGVREGGK